jgi:hypothetical protein
VTVRTLLDGTLKLLLDGRRLAFEAIPIQRTFLKSFDKAIDRRLGRERARGLTFVRRMENHPSPLAPESCV